MARAPRGQKYLEYQRLYAARRAVIVRGYVAQHKTKPCLDCGGWFHPFQMDFDHRPGTTKAFRISTVGCNRWSRIEAEIEKCDLVCANCHRLRTWVRKRYKKAP